MGGGGGGGSGFTLTALVHNTTDSNSTFRQKMDLFDFKLRLGVSRSHSVRDKSTVLNVYFFPNTIGVSGIIIPEVTIESSSTIRKSFNYTPNLETCNIHNLLRPCDVSKYYLFVFSSA